MRQQFALMLLTLGSIATSVTAEDRPAEKILAEYDAIVTAAPDAAKFKTARALRDARFKRQKALERRAALALELYLAHPEQERLASMLRERWELRLNDPKRALELQKEIEKVLAKSKNDPVLGEAAFVRASILASKKGQSAAAVLKAIDDFIRRAPDDERGAMLLCGMVDRLDKPRQVAVINRIVKDYPESAYAKNVEELKNAVLGTSSLVQATGIGKPFELEFTDAITGHVVSVQNLRGKVVVIDFWATWCGPCVAEMPKMKEIYARYRSRGVEFIGVSLDQPRDQGGYDKLVDFVSTNEIPWPQYYQGDGWNSKFSASWEVRAIPACFLIDTEGKLITTSARGKLDELIPSQLARANR